MKKIDHFGIKQLAYKFSESSSEDRRPAYGRYFGMTFIAKPNTLKEVQHLIDVSEIVMRQNVVKLDSGSLFSKTARREDGSFTPKDEKKTTIL